MKRDLERYHEQSRRLEVSLVAILPLLAIYEVGLLLLAPDVENHAGLLVKRMIAHLGTNVYLILTGMVCVLFGFALREKARGPARGFDLYWLLLLEATFYAVLLGPLSLAARGLFTWALPEFLAAGVGGDRLERALLYVGAGVWEEIVFRLVFVGGFLGLSVGLLRGQRKVFVPLAVLFGALAFSLFHHWGPGEPFEVPAFVFRLAAGVFLGILFVLRGLGICVYTHAIYNVGLIFYS